MGRRRGVTTNRLWRGRATGSPPQGWRRSVVYPKAAPYASTLAAPGTVWLIVSATARRPPAAPQATFPISTDRVHGPHGDPGTQCSAQHESGRFILCTAGSGVTGRGGDWASRPESSPSPGPERAHKGPAVLDARPARADARDAARVAATRSHGLSGSDRSATAEAVAVHPAPPDRELVAKPPRASEPGHTPGTRTAGLRSAASRGSPAHSVSVERHSAGDHRRIPPRPAAKWRR